MAKYKESWRMGEPNLDEANRSPGRYGKNVDEERLKDNVYFVDHTLEEAYKAAYGQAIEEFNSRQSRPDQHKTPESYLKEITDRYSKERKKIAQNKRLKNKAPHPAYGIIVTCGNVENAGTYTHPELQQRITDALTEYHYDFKARNEKYFYIVQANIHRDEKMPAHYNLVFLPQATGYKQGLQVRNGLVQALANMGYKNMGKELAVSQWQTFERQRFIEIAQKHGLEVYYEHTGTKENLKPHEYRRVADIAKQKMQVKADKAVENAHARVKEKLAGNFLGYVKAEEAQKYAKDAVEAAELKNAEAEMVKQEIQKRQQELDRWAAEIREREQKLNETIRKIRDEANEQRKRAEVEKEAAENARMALEIERRNNSILKNKNGSLKLNLEARYKEGLREGMESQIAEIKKWQDEAEVANDKLEKIKSSMREKEIAAYERGKIDEQEKQMKQREKTERIERTNNLMKHDFARYKHNAQVLLKKEIYEMVFSKYEIRTKQKSENAQDHQNDYSL